MKDQQETYKDIQQKIDKQYKEHEGKYSELIAQIQELENKPNKSDLERVKLDILKAQNVQMDFQRARDRKEKFEALMGNVMLDDLKYHFNITKTLFLSLVTGIMSCLLYTSPSPRD